MRRLDVPAAGRAPPAARAAPPRVGGERAQRRDPQQPAGRASPSVGAPPAPRAPARARRRASCPPRSRRGSGPLSPAQVGRPSASRWNANGDPPAGGEPAHGWRASPCGAGASRSSRVAVVSGMPAAARQRLERVGLRGRLVRAPAGAMRGKRTRDAGLVAAARRRMPSKASSKTSSGFDRAHRAEALDACCARIQRSTSRISASVSPE